MAFYCTSKRFGYERVVYLLSTYPILRSILANSHRQSIVNLATTCSGLYEILSVRVGALKKAFPGCLADLKRCTMCQVPVCADCRLATVELEKPASMLNVNHNGCPYTLVYGHTPASQTEMSDFLTRPHQQWVYGLARHQIEHNQFCHVCFRKHQPNIRHVISQARSELLGATIVRIELEANSPQHAATIRRLVVMFLNWGDLPQGRNTAPYHCDEFNTGCDISPHYVRVKDLPVDAELVAFVSQRGRAPIGATGYRSKCPVYFLRHGRAAVV